MHSPRSLQAILFDLDETLFDRSAAVFATARAMGRSLMEGHPTLNLDEFVATFAEVDEGGYSGLPKHEFARIVMERHGITTMNAHDFVSLRDKFNLEVGSLFPGTLETLKWLGDSFKLGIVSNATRYEHQRAKVTQLGLDPLMDSVVISTDNLRKPNKEIFFKALAELGVESSHAAFVGDNPIADIEGANSAGMLSIYSPQRPIRPFVPNRGFGN